MEGIEFSAAVQQWTNDILVWVGFGTIVGLLAKATMPGRDPGGAVATLAMGVGYIVMLGLVGIGAAAAVATGMRARVHQTLTVAFVMLSLIGVYISAVTLLFLAIGLFNLGPISLDLWPQRWRRGAR